MINLMILQEKTLKNIIQVGHKFQSSIRRLIIGGSGSGKRHKLFNLISR